MNEARRGETFLDIPSMTIDRGRAVARFIVVIELDGGPNELSPEETAQFVRDAKALEVRARAITDEGQAALA